MKISINQIKPKYMSESELSGSDIYLQDDLVFESGKKYLIKSNSGNGKSSFLNFIFQSNLNFTGSIKYLNINNDNLIYLRRNKLSYVFQDFKLFPELNIIENLRLKNNLTEYKSDQELLDLIEKVDLINKKDSLIRELSLGQRQRVAIIRSLCQPFSFLLLDEPFSHLDDSNIEILTNLIDQELESRQAGMILTTLNNEYLFSYDKKINL
tara:strand:- start:426 stop:1055 length:630 start_codon:yes stop_codon:yes gene_type:complete